MLVSIVIRTLNEERYLGELLSVVAAQTSDIFTFEVVLVDSGSTDDTLNIAESNGCRITHINKKDFSFGRSLNQGCDFANGKILVFISGHCVPTDAHWLENLCKPIHDKKVAYSYGRQIGRDTTKFSERQVFAKYFPQYSMVPQNGFFCNNANAAVLREPWERFRFDEELTGLEDMHFAKRLVEDGQQVGYVSDAAVYHIHDELWSQVMNRYEREAIALQKVSPEIQVTFLDFLRFYISSVLLDSGVSLGEKAFLKQAFGILIFRFCQFWGGYRGNRVHRKLSAKNKRQYFYPTEKL